MSNICRRAGQRSRPFYKDISSYQVLKDVLVNTRTGAFLPRLLSGAAVLVNAARLGRDRAPVWRERGASALEARVPGAPTRLPGSPLCSQEDVSVKSRVGQVDCPGEGHACRPPEPSLPDTGIMLHNAYNYGKWFPFSAKRGGREGEKAVRSRAGASTQALGLV